MRGRASRAARAAGFTLLELVLAIGLLALLVGMIFAVASQNIALGQMVVQTQNEESIESAFFDLMEEQFGSLPGNARLELTSQDSGAQYLSELTLQDVPMTFTWGGTEQVAKAVRLSTVRRRDGFLDIMLGYYDVEILEGTAGAGEEIVPDAEPYAQVALLEDVYIFEWRVLDGRTLEWTYEWDFVGRQPLQLELRYVKDLYADPIRHVFWITPKQNPENLMRQLGGNARGGGGGPGGGDGEDEPGGDIEIDAGTVSPQRPERGGRQGRQNRAGQNQGGRSR